MISNIFYLLRFLGVVVATAHQTQVLVLVLFLPQVLQMLAQVAVLVRRNLEWVWQVRRM